MATSTPSKSPVLNWLIIGVVLIGGLIYLAISRKHAAENAPVVAAGAGGGVLEAANVAGRPAPEWTLQDVDGKPVSLKQFAGHPVVMDFWATWCGPCQIEIPWWQDLQKKYAAQGLVIIGVSEDSNLADVQKYLKANPLNYQIVWDNATLQSTYGTPFGLPTTLYINKEGKIVSRVSGLEGKPDLENRIKEIL